jgi:hypothetical protein
MRLGMRSILISLLFVCLSISSGFSQNDADLFRYSKTETFGSARFEAMGGAFGALGADLSVSQINPAGFGRFSTNQLNLSLGGSVVNNKLTFKGNTTTSNSFTLKPNAIGIVFIEDESRKNRGYQYMQVGIGYNRIQDFRNSFSYSGFQFESLLESFAASANGTPYYDLYLTHPFSSSLAWETYTINPAGGNNYEAALYNSGDQFHRREVETKGGMGEYYLSFSGNFINALYLGANIGFRTLKYEENLSHYEEVTDTTGNELRSFDYAYYLKTKGNGLNVKLGLIYLPKDNVRLGLAIHTPTFYELEDDTEADMTATFDYGVRTVSDSLKPVGNYKYRLRTPPRVVGSFAYIFGTRGCISADLEYVNYKWAHLRSTKDLTNYQRYDFTIENAEAKKVLQSALNLRIGGEFVFNSVFFLRAGVGLSTKAYNSKVDVENGLDKSYSCGLGFKFGQYTFDLSLKQTQFSRVYTAFQGSTAQNDFARTSFVLGFSYLL